MLVGATITQSDGHIHRVLYKHIKKSPVRKHFDQN